MARALFAAAALVLLVSACSDDDPTATAASSTTVEILSEPDIPDELNPDADPSQMQIAQDISIEAGTVVPLRLIAIAGNEITFTNNTDGEVTVNFRNGAIDEAGNRSSGPIPAGGTFSFVSETVRNITYEVNGDPNWRGSIQVDPGEF